MAPPIGTASLTMALNNVLPSLKPVAAKATRGAAKPVGECSELVVASPQSDPLNLPRPTIGHPPLHCVQRPFR